LSVNWRETVKKPKWDIIGLTHALRGIRCAVIKERNLKIHIITGVFVVIAALSFSTSTVEKIILVLTIAIVIFAELFNTAIESVVDLICIENNDKAKLAKDVAAGAVLITVIMSVIVGVMIFLPKIIDRINSTF
jgi:diacylglycerol kinase